MCREWGASHGKTHRERSGDPVSSLAEAASLVTMLCRTSLRAGACWAACAQTARDPCAEACMVDPMLWVQPAQCVWAVMLVCIALDGVCMQVGAPALLTLQQARHAVVKHCAASRQTSSRADWRRRCIVLVCASAGKEHQPTDAPGLCLLSPQRAQQMLPAPLPCQRSLRGRVWRGWRLQWTRR